MQSGRLAFNHPQAYIIHNHHPCTALVDKMRRVGHIALLAVLFISPCLTAVGTGTTPYVTIEKSSAERNVLFRLNPTLTRVELHEHPPELVLYHGSADSDQVETIPISYRMVEFLANHIRRELTFTPAPEHAYHLRNRAGRRFILKELRWSGEEMVATTLLSNRTFIFHVSDIVSVKEVGITDIEEGQYRPFDDSGIGAIMTTARSAAQPWQFGINLASILTIPIPSLAMTFPNRSDLHATAIPGLFGEPVYYGTVKTTLFENRIHAVGLGVYADLIKGHGHDSGQFEPEWFQWTDEKYTHFRAIPILLYTLGSNTSLTAAGGISAGGDLWIAWGSFQHRIGRNRKFMIDLMSVRDQVYGAIVYRFIWPNNTFDVMLMYAFIPSKIA